MSGYSRGAIMGGIGQGIDKAVSGILNLYGMQQRFDQQQQKLEIEKQNSATYHRMMHYNLASRFERDAGVDLSKWRTPSVRRPMPGGVGTPQAMRLGVDSLSLQDPTLPAATGDPRFMQPGADALLDY